MSNKALTETWLESRGFTIDNDGLRSVDVAEGTLILLLGCNHFWDAIEFHQKIEDSEEVDKVRLIGRSFLVRSDIVRLLKVLR